MFLGGFLADLLAILSFWVLQVAYEFLEPFIITLCPQCSCENLDLIQLHCIQSVVGLQSQRLKGSSFNSWLGVFITALI